MKKKYFSTLLIFIGAAGSHLWAQSNFTNNWTVKGFESKVFIENKGQFDSRNQFKGNSINSKIAYGIDNNGSKIFFTAEGLTYRFDRTEFTKEHEGKAITNTKETDFDLIAEMEREKKNRIITRSYFVNMKWLGANPGVIIETLEPQSEYYNYTLTKDEHIFGARAFKKLVYKNLYPNIDVEYVFHPVEGIKYSFILHPGADASQIKMQYSGSKNIYQDDKGHIHFSTEADDIIDHAPETFYENREKISSSFKLNGNIVSFILDHYDTSKKIIIDPWTTNPAFASDNKVFDIQTDGVGNVYVYGSQNPYKARKYNSTGVMQWTYNTPNSDSPGDIAVDPAGNCFITDGHASSPPGTSIIKLDPSGNILFSVASGYSLAHEFWRLIFNCDFSTLVVAGAFVNGPPITSYNIGFINTNTGVVTHNVNPYTDMRSLISAPNGRYYTLDAVNIAGTPIQLYSFSSALAFTFSVATVPIGIYGGPAYSNSTYLNRAGYNGLAADANFIFTTNGLTVYRRSLSTGAQVGGSLTVPSGITDQNSGIAVDACGNVYIGSQNVVYKYDPTLTTQLGSAATPGAVYDVIIGNGGEILTCGDGFIASLGGFSACAPVCPLAPLPIEIISFESHCTGNNIVRLDWSTATETNNDYFTIERSADCNLWETIGTVDGAGNSTSTLNYEFIDDEVSGIKYKVSSIYYRIKQTDYASKFEYFTPIAAEICADFSIFPNPADNEFSIRVFSETDDEIVIEVYDVIGKLILSKSASVTKGNNMLSLDISSITSQIYILNLKTKTHRVHQKFTKKQ